MTDIALFLGADGASADIGIVNGDIGLDDTLYTSVILSLMTRRRAGPDDEVPQGQDPGGWWGDAYLPPLPDGSADASGSKLWLRRRVEATNASAQLIRGDVLDALNWMILDRIATSVDVTTSWNSGTALAIGTTITQLAAPGSKPTVKTYSLVWDKTLGLVS